MIEIELSVKKNRLPDGVEEVVVSESVGGGREERT